MRCRALEYDSRGAHLVDAAVQIGVWETSNLPVCTEYEQRLMYCCVPEKHHQPRLENEWRDPGVAQCEIDIAMYTYAIIARISYHTAFVSSILRISYVSIFHVVCGKYII